MNIYELFVDEETNGVSAISLVENPAVEYNFMVFNKEKMMFNIENLEKRTVWCYNVGRYSYFEKRK